MGVSQSLFFLVSLENQATKLVPPFTPNPLPPPQKKERKKKQQKQQQALVTFGFWAETAAHGSFLVSVRRTDQLGPLFKDQGIACMILWMDEIHFAPPKKPRNDSIPLQMPINHGVPWCSSGAGLRPSTVLMVSLVSCQSLFSVQEF